MAGSDVTLTKLTSRDVRKTVTGDEEGIRFIKADSEATNENTDNLIGKIGGVFKDLLGGKNFVGWLFGELSSRFRFTFSFSSAWGLAVQQYNFAYNFNWNASDDQLDQSLKGMSDMIASQLGATLGNLAGYMVCGVLPSATIAYFNEPLGLKLLADVGEEALEEFADNFGALLHNLFLLATRAFFVNMYKSGRRMVKNFFKDPNSAQSKMLNSIFGQNSQKMIQSWGDGKSSWSFAKKVEDTIDGIKSPFWRNFTEEFVEEMGEACIEAGYIIAQGLDTWAVEKATEKDIALGRERIVEIIPNRDAPEERVVAFGREELIKPQIVQYLQSHSLVENRDIGQVIGEPIKEAIKKDRLTLGVHITFKDKRLPPFGNKKTTSIFIPQVDRMKLDNWERLKLACGGDNGYLWGRYRATANMSHGGQMQVWGGTADEAEDRLRALAIFSESTILTVSILEETTYGMRERNQPLFKETTRVYPCYFTVINQQKMFNEISGKATLTGVYKQRKYQIPLWHDNPPPNYQDIIKELLHIAGSNQSSYEG